jgi:hypothetical protein
LERLNLPATTQEIHPSLLVQRGLLLRLPLRLLRLPRPRLRRVNSRQ